MRIAVVGSGGREHALAWKIAQSPLVDQVLCLPGNPGTAAEPKVANMAVDLRRVGQTATALRSLRPELVVVGPEGPLVAGLADRLREGGVAVVGPGASGARLEGSKAFAKALLRRAGVPTARAFACREMDEALEAIGRFEVPPVIKADGLAGGKGVVVAQTREEAVEAARAALVGRRFGAAGETLLVEERLEGVEASYIVLTDGERFAALPTSQDHKRLLDGDRGPNTGGMGAYLPNPHFRPELEARVASQVVGPLLRVLAEDGIPYRGFLYAGLMLGPESPKVLEINVRSGDPETQAILFGLDDDLVPVLLEVAGGRLAADRVLTARPAATVVLASRGYPESPDVGMPIAGLEAAAALDDVKVFHAGTRRGPDGRLETAGGRVLAVTARADALDEALARAYAAVEGIRFEGMQVRGDIGRGRG